MTSPIWGRRRGFTLIELLVVIAIIAILIALLVPAVQKVRQSAATTQLQNNLKQVALGFHNFHDARGVLPTSLGRIPNAGSLYQWTSQMIPFLEQNALQDTIAPTGTWSTTPIPVFLTALDTSAPGSIGHLGDAIGNIGANFQIVADATKTGTVALEGKKMNLKRSFVDGTSNTILLATRYGKCGKGVPAGSPDTGTNWSSIALQGYYVGSGGGTRAPIFGHMLPNTAGVGVTFQVMPTEPGGPRPCNPDYAHTFIGGLLNVAMMDGAVLGIQEGVPGIVWRNLLIPDDQNTIDMQWIR